MSSNHRSTHPPQPDPRDSLSSAPPPSTNHDNASRPDSSPDPTAASPISPLPETRLVNLHLPAPGTFPGFEILREISRGGQGVVYQALQTATNRKVAIKVLRDGQFATDSALRRFQREIELVAQLNHPNIISIFHADLTSDGRKFYAMDYIRGLPLTAYIRRHQPPIPAIIDLVRKICDAMQYAHHRGIIHRDLKPNNILVDQSAEPKILDFGLAKLQFGLGPANPSLTNELLGTLPYMSPEQVRGSPDRIDAATDVYSLGIILHQCLVGRFPYPVDGDPHETMSNILHAQPARPSRERPDLDDELDTIIAECLAKDPSRRYPSAGPLAEDLRRYREGQPIFAKRDSIAYVLRKKTLAASQRHRITSLALALLLAVTLSLFPGDSLITNWTPLKVLFERAAASVQPAAPINAPLRDVRIIAFDDDTPFADLARAEESPNFHLSDNFPLRALHGRLMRRLARVRPRVVAWDIKFVEPSPYDDAFIDGALQLREQGIDVITAVPGWWADDLGRPNLSPRIARAVRWASVLLGDERIPWQLQLIMQRGVRDPLPSLSLAAAAAFRHPAADSSFILDGDNRRILIRYRQSSADIAKPWIADPDIIHLGELLSVKPSDEAASTPGLQVGDTIGLHLFNMPADETLQQATIDYASVFAAGDAQLSEWFNDRAVLIADLRAGIDRHSYGPDRSIPGVYAHAVVLDQLLTELEVPHDRPVPLTASRAADRLACGLIGIAIICLIPCRRALVAILASLLLIGISLYLAAAYRYLWNPLGGIFALLLATLFAALVYNRPAPSRGRASQ